MAKFEVMMKLFGEVRIEKARAELNLQLARKKMQDALMSGDEKAVEAARQECMATFEAALDIVISIHKRIDSIKAIAK